MVVKDCEVQDEVAIISESWKDAFLELGLLFGVFCVNVGEYFFFNISIKS